MALSASCPLGGVAASLLDESVRVCSSVDVDCGSCGEACWEFGDTLLSTRTSSAKLADFSSLPSFCFKRLQFDNKEMGVINPS